ncbi:hypothetical protein BZG76_08470 [Salinivibrio sp. AR647]|uniref:hypothetical protein n=1 Tax=Salinivibrio sp. AR647 TaxID=1909438 RepID=UPI0009876146|nr:hypothetical protein [Salinivibrio sp. AR647]OOE92550.1 hypothetical protein BZG76_08470 [Salinivibrio sp. AR647]
MNKKQMIGSLFGLGLLTGAAQASTDSVEQALVMVNSGELQTQGMAMVLANTMQAQGTHVDVLLCGKAGELAFKGTENSPLKPKNVTPEQLMMKLKKGGANVSVCALFLPNSDKGKTALRAGISVAKPPQISQIMRDKNTRVFSF